MLGSENVGSWRPLVEYSLKKGVSLSTLRRYIKAGKLRYRVENGRYLLFDGDHAISNDASYTQPNPPNSEADRLRLELKEAREEIAELKTLIAFYEEQPQRSSS